MITGDPYLVGITGYLFEEYTADEIAIIESLLDNATQGAENLGVLSHFINVGISKVAYDWAWRRKLPTAGIAAESCWDYPCRLVQKRLIYEGGWEDTVEAFSNACHGVIVFGETEITEEIMRLCEDKDKQVIDLSRELATIEFVPDKGI